MATKTTTPAAEFKNILLKDIEADINQPRKFFDEHSLAELAASVKANGVLQPIMVRPNGKKYLLVYGERRYKAALVIGLKEIPAIVRELSDAQALDIQITENLQRKDVHPMEEAVAFKKLLDSFTIEDIALRVGKSESFVAKRIQLTELVEDAQQVFFLNKITISDAIKLARLDADMQQEVLSDVLPEDWKEDEDFQISKWKSISQYVHNKENDLSEAIFKLSEKMLYKEAGACVGCKFNSASVPLLFEEEEKQHSVCRKPSCFQIKTQRQEQKNLEKLATDPTRIVIEPRSLSEEGKAKIEMAKELGIKVIPSKDYDIVSTPDAILSFEQWKEDQYYEDDDDSEDDIKNQYNDYVEELEEEHKEYNELLKTGNVVTAYNMFRNEEVTIRITAEVKDEVEQSTGDAGHDATKDEIEKIKTREARAKELDAEKVWEKIRGLLSVESHQNSIYNLNTFNKTETQALGAALYTSLGYHTRKLAEKMICMDSYKESAATFQYTYSSINTLERLLIIEKLVVAFGSHIQKGSNNKLAYEFIKQYLPAEVGKIELEQQEIAEARGERVTKRIAVLKDKLILN
jgi:ParB/RepB/Spo0J family partition protein